MSTEVTETSTALTVLPDKPEMVLLDKEVGHAFYLRCKAEVESFVPDTSTQKGRKEIAALAYKVARTKTTIDNAGKTLNEKLREQIDVVDESRRDIREKFDALKEQARKPLTDWEQAEAARVERRDSILNALHNAGTILSSDTSRSVTDTLSAVQEEQVTAELYGEDVDIVAAAKANAERVLHDAIDALKKQEAEAIELAQLRAEKAERDARDAAERQEAERKRAEEERAAQLESQRKFNEEQARLAAERAEAERIAREKAEAERIEKARAEAAEKARIETERLAQEAFDKQRRELLEIAEREQRETQRKYAEKERIAEEEVARLRQEAFEREQRDLRIQQESDRIRAAQRAEEEQARKKSEDSIHRAGVIGAAEDDLKAGGVPAVHAKRVMALIAAGKISRVSVEY